MSRGRHSWHDIPVDPDHPGPPGRQCTRCYKLQTRESVSNWGQAIVSRWYPPAGRCVPPDLTRLAQEDAAFLAAHAAKKQAQNA